MPFEDGPQLGTATAELINLSPASRAAIQRYDPFIINAGYRDGMGVIFVGEVVSAVSKRSGTEWRTSVTAAEAASAWQNSKINKTYERDTKASDIFRDGANIMGLEIGEVSPLLDIEFPHGKTCVGSTGDMLASLAQNDCKSRFLIHKGQLIINDPQKGLHEGYLLSKETGLLRHDEDMEVLPMENALDEGQAAQDRQPPTRTRTCLLNHCLCPSDIVVIQSRSLSGSFQILRGRHTGSQDGAWTTEIEVKPV